MIIFDTQTIILAIIGMIGLLATATVTIYAFKRNTTGINQFE